MRIVWNNGTYRMIFNNLPNFSGTFCRYFLAKFHICRVLCFARDCESALIQKASKLKIRMSEEEQNNRAINSAVSIGTQCGDGLSYSEDIVVLSHCLSPIRANTDVSIPHQALMESNEMKCCEEQELTKNCAEKRRADEELTKKDLKKAKLETKALKAKRPGFTDDRYDETSYYFENGLRKVYPYYFTFTTFTKGRWVGEKILDVFAREFRAHPATEYERCIQSGSLTVNYKKVSTDYELKHNDLLANIVHRHEVPVTSQPVTIIFMDEDLVVVNKPASIPVHPCGRYRHNTIVFILAKEYNLKNLRTIHRLDRLTSGLLMFGRSPKKAREMEHQIRNRIVQKDYVCKVEGEFPKESIECSEPIEVISYKIGVCKVSPNGKTCSTFFERLGFDGKNSIVLCRPKTGRMHQIRVHLQYLGYPIINDPLYNHPVFGPLKGKGGDLGGKTNEELIQDLIHIHNAENWLGVDGDVDLTMFNAQKDLDKTQVELTLPENDQTVNDTSVTVSSESEMTCNKQSKMTQTGHEVPDSMFNPEKMTADEHCYECKVNYRDPKPQDLIMYLHAWSYKGSDWEYRTPLPDWAKTEWSNPLHNNS
ncbi:RNA pseudouridylate synthase domain-containing protein 2-like [Coccinella septempunctata]|uniref:RNA pseudouridylate synthase domain-containing protein 2-like n=1 Tax=Coccinella septempunctata TaxID=41139 RepID=UPI001D0876A9|nr:RNA pseudouridylate synthase domain-containing protein 2-like [Coccinella septempunctata]